MRRPISRICAICPIGLTRLNGLDRLVVQNSASTQDHQQSRQEDGGRTKDRHDSAQERTGWAVVQKVGVVGGGRRRDQLWRNRPPLTAAGGSSGRRG